MTQNKKYAVTGGIGSGKSLVLKILKELGYKGFSCDEVSHELWRDGDYRAALARLFPDCTKRGEIDRELLRERVFSDEAALDRLNAFSHPRIMEELLRRAEKEKVCFCEVPLLYEGGYGGLFDGVLALRRREGARLEAVASRDGLEEEDILARMRRQIDPATLEGRGCYVIENDGTADDLREKLLVYLRTLS